MTQQLAGGVFNLGALNLHKTRFCEDTLLLRLERANGTYVKGRRSLSYM
jgi:hypothetical protein